MDPSQSRNPASSLLRKLFELNSVPLTITAPFSRLLSFQSPLLGFADMPIERGGAGRWPAFASFAGAYLLSGFLRSSNAVITNELSSDLQLTAGQLGFVTAAFLLPFAVAQLPVGHALDRYGARRVVPTLMSVAVAGTLLVAFAPTFALMSVGRAAQGLGLSGVLMGGLKALSTYFPGRRFTLVSAELVAFGAVGALLATTPLAWLSSTLGWRTAFVLAALALVLSTTAVAVWGKAPFPGVPNRYEGYTRVFSSLRFWRLLFASFAFTGSLLAIQGLWAGPYLRNGYGLSQSTAGNLLIALNAGLVVGYLASGWLGRRYGKGRSLLAAYAVFLLLQLLLALQPPAGVVVLAGLFLLLGLTGSFHVLLYSRGQELFPEPMTGHVVTAINLAMFTGGFALQFSMGLLAPSERAAGTGSYTLAFLLSAAISGIALITVLPELKADEGGV